MAVVLALAGGSAIFAQGTQERGWPRVKTAADGTRAVVYQPQIDEWNSYVDLKYRVAVELWLPGARNGVPGAVLMTAETNTDLAKRSVILFNQKIVQATFPGTDADTAQGLTAALARVVPSSPMTASLDDLLAYFEPGQQAAPPKPPDTRQLAGTPEPPSIVYSTSPAVLVLFDGEPVFAPVEKTGLRFAVNTNWSVFQEEGKPQTYLLNGSAWLKAPSPTGPWEPADKPPQSFWSLPKTSNWADVHKSLPGKPITRAQMPRVFVSLKPTELILMEGAINLATVPGTRLSWVTNTDSDLFFQSTRQSFYFLTSGRWFRAGGLDGPWSYAGSELPADFNNIPKDHPRARVRVSVPGTPEAQEAVMLAQVPQKVEVKRSEVKVNVTYTGAPQFKPIDGTSMSYATNTSYDVILVNNSYYTCHQAVWFVSTSPSGPWVVADSVPQAIYTLPPSCPKYNVTYVTVYESTPSTVVVGYTSGYMGVYVASGVVVYGTSYYYPPYYYYPPGIYYPIYYPTPYTYGVKATYNPYTGTYARTATAYGPYGGVGYGVAYNPTTGTYARGVAAAGPYQAGYAAQAYNPRTGTYAATYQRSNPYAQWGQSVVTKGDEWAKGGHYTDSRGTVGGIQTSQGGKAIGVSTDHGNTAIAKSGQNNNMYAAHDGNVYKNTGSGWQSYNNGSWDSVNKPQSGAASTSAQQRTAGGAAAQPKTTASQQPAAGGGARATPSNSGGASWSQNSAQLQRDQQARSSSAQRQYSGGGGRSSGGGGRSRGGGGGGGGGRR
jgi:hypothetical protein